MQLLPINYNHNKFKKASENYLLTSVDTLKNITDNNILDESYFINSTAQEIKNFKNKDQSFSFIKKIKDIFDNDLYYLQYQETSAIVNINNYETLEISNNLYDEEKFDKEIAYIPSVGLTYKQDKQLYSIEKNLVMQEEILSNILSMKHNYNYFLESNKIENKKTRDVNFEKYNKEIKIRKKRSYRSKSQSSTYANNISVSHEVPYSWCFKKLDSYSRLGYTETPSGGGLDGIK